MFHPFSPLVSCISDRIRCGEGGRFAKDRGADGGHIGEVAGYPNSKQVSDDEQTPRFFFFYFYFFSIWGLQGSGMLLFYMG